MFSDYLWKPSLSSNGLIQYHGRKTIARYGLETLNAVQALLLEGSKASFKSTIKSHKPNTPAIKRYTSPKAPRRMKTVARRGRKYNEVKAPPPINNSPNSRPRLGSTTPFGIGLDLVLPIRPSKSRSK